MRDVVFVLITVAFFFLAGAYVTFCDRVSGAEDASGAGPELGEEGGLEVGARPR